MQMSVRKISVGMEAMALILQRIKFAYGINAEVCRQTIVLRKFFYVFLYMNFLWAVTDKHQKFGKVTFVILSSCHDEKEINSSHCF